MRWLDGIAARKAAGTDANADREGLNERSARMTALLTSLALDIVKAAIECLLPEVSGIFFLMDTPTGFADQGPVAGLRAST